MVNIQLKVLSQPDVEFLEDPPDLIGIADRFLTTSGTGKESVLRRNPFRIIGAVAKPTVRMVLETSVAKLFLDSGNLEIAIEYR